MRAAAASVELHRAVKPATYHRPTRMGLCALCAEAYAVSGGLCVSLTQELHGSSANRRRFVTPRANRSNELAEGMTGCDHETTPVGQISESPLPRASGFDFGGVAMRALRAGRAVPGAGRRTGLGVRHGAREGCGFAARSLQEILGIPRRSRFREALRGSRRAVSRSALSPRPQVPSWSGPFAPGPQPEFLRLRDLAPQKANPVASASIPSAI